MAKLHSTLCALGALSITAVSFAQKPAPIEAPVVPPTGAAPAVPAPIEPPITVPNVPPAPVPGFPSAPGTLDASNGTTGLAPTATRTSEFQGDEISLVLRTLGRQAHMNLVISDKVQTTAGTVTMRIEDKTPKEAIEIIVTSKGLIMDEDKGVFFVKTPEERAKEPTESGSYTFSYAKAKDVITLVQAQLQSAVAPQVDDRTNTVYYREAKSNMEKIHLFLEGLDKPTKQVMIEARLVEVIANPTQSYGINWGGVVGSASSPQTFRYGGSTPGAGKIQTDTNPLTGQSTQRAVQDKLPGIVTDVNGRLNAQDFLLNGQTTGGFADVLGSQFAILSVPAMSATLRFLNEDKDAEFLANPRVVTASNQKATIKITRAQPVPQLNFNEQTAQAVFSGFQDKEFGNTLDVTPIINKDDFISMNVKPEISNKVGDATFSFGGAVVSSPVIDKRTLDSNVLIKSGDTLAIGGLLQDEQGKQSNKVPFMGDIPFIGYLFQEKLNTRTKRNLLIFITPTIIKQGYGTGLEDQVAGLQHSGNEFADPNGWRNNAKGAVQLVPTSHRSITQDIPKPGFPPAPKKVSYKVNASAR